MLESFNVTRNIINRTKVYRGASNIYANYIENRIFLEKPQYLQGVVTLYDKIVQAIVMPTITNTTNFLEKPNIIKGFVTLLCRQKAGQWDGGTRREKAGQWGGGTKCKKCNPVTKFAHYVTH